MWRRNPYKMDELKSISHKQLNKFIKGRRFRGRNDYVSKDLTANRKNDLILIMTPEKQEKKLNIWMLKGGNFIVTT